MKRLKLLATFIFLAHNAWAGWHTNEPFVAWPATNHLRWMTNVVVATNASHWTNSAYGQWTNNYVVTNLWIGDAGYLGSAANFPFPMDAIGQMTNMAFNAKDVRILDCTLAVAERFVVASRGAYAMTNVWYWLAYDYWGDSYYSADGLYFEYFFRNERKVLQNLKATVLNDLLVMRPWYQWDGTNITALTESLLCSNAAVPPNFLRYTPFRAADMTSTAYGRIVTNSWTLNTGSTNVTTNTVIDSFKGTHDLIGTNGQTFSLIVTNANIAEGYRAEHYGWDGLKAVLTNLILTGVNNYWGIGSGTNQSEAAWSNAPAVMASSPPAPIDPVTVPGNTNQQATIQATNSWPGEDIWMPESWEWYWPSAASAVTETGKPPESIWSANYLLAYSAEVRYRNYGVADPDTWYVDSLITNGLTVAHTNRWREYDAPLYCVSSGGVSRTLDYYMTSNGVSKLLLSTNVDAATYSITTDPYAVSTPAIDTTFGISTGTVTSMTYGSGDWDSISWGRYLQAGAGAIASYTAATNMTFPAYSNSLTLERWDFIYK